MKYFLLLFLLTGSFVSAQERAPLQMDSVIGMITCTDVISVNVKLKQDKIFNNLLKWVKISEPSIVTISKDVERGVIMGKGAVETSVLKSGKLEKAGMITYDFYFTCTDGNFVYLFMNFDHYDPDNKSYGKIEDWPYNGTEAETYENFRKQLNEGLQKTIASLKTYMLKIK